MFYFNEGEWFPWWAVLFLPFLFWLYILHRRTRHVINWRAAWLTVIIFEIVLGATEAFSVSRGHWVYNEARIWGPRWFNVPIEEHLLYYPFSSLIVISAMYSVRLSLAKWSGRRWSP